MLRRMAMCLLTVPWLAGAATAENSAASCSPDTSIKPVSTQARRESAGDAGCRYIDAQELATLSDSARRIDARAAVAYRSVQIAEATRVDAAPIGGDLDAAVVIGSGWNRQEERRACNALVAKGYGKVVVLRGGLRSWVRAGMPIWADAGGVSALSIASPAEAHAAAMRGDAQFVVLPERGQSVACPGDVPNVHCVASYRKALKQLSRHRPDQVTMLSASDVDFARAELALSRRQISGLVRVSGGTDAVRTHFATYPSIAQSSSQALWIPCHRR